MEKNNNPEINRLNMETSKSVAESMKSWEGLDASKAPVASSFLNGSTGQMLKESANNEYFPKSNNTVFSFGLVNTISALRNSTLNELPAGKILLDKYESLILHNGISEAFVFESFLNDLCPNFSFIFISFYHTIHPRVTYSNSYAHILNRMTFITNL